VRAPADASGATLAATRVAAPVNASVDVYLGDVADTRDAAPAPSGPTTSDIATPDEQLGASSSSPLHWEVGALTSAGRLAGSA